MSMSANTTLSKNQRRRNKLQAAKDPFKNNVSDEALLDQLIAKNKAETTLNSAASATGTNTSTGAQSSTQPTAQPASTPSTTQPDVITRTDVIKKAEKMWEDVKEYARTHPDYKNMKDKDKLDLFRKGFGYEEFMNEFPIVGRYMVCFGQYSTKAFNRFLDKTEKVKHPPPAEREKGYMEDQWIRRQADYAAFLWEAYQKRHFNTAERKWVWQETYKRLRGEFDDFRNMHKDIEEKVKEEKVELAARNVKELLERLKTGKQALSREDEEFLLYELTNLTYRKNFDDTLTQLLATRPVVEHTHSGTGTGQEPSDAPKVTMIETVDVNRMGEIDDKYRPAELRGMEPVLEESGRAADTVVESGVLNIGRLAGSQ